MIEIGRVFACCIEGSITRDVFDGGKDDDRACAAGFTPWCIVLSFMASFIEVAAAFVKLKGAGSTTLSPRALASAMLMKAPVPVTD